YILMPCEEQDKSSELIAHWLGYQGASAKRLTEKSIVENPTCYQKKENVGFKIETSEDCIDSKDSGCYYYRRGDINFKTTVHFEGDNSVECLQEIISMNSYYKSEYRSLKETIHYILRNSEIPNICSFFDLD